MGLNQNSPRAHFAFFLAVSCMLCFAIPVVYAEIDSVTLLDPADAIVLDDPTPDFTFTASSTLIDENATGEMTCTLYVDDAVAAQETGVGEAETEITPDDALADGSHNWTVGCMDADLVEVTATTQTFMIDTEPTEPEGSISDISMYANNADPSRAKAGDEITLAFSVSNPSLILIVTVNGNVVTADQVMPSQYLAQYTVQSDDSGPAKFTIDCLNVQLASCHATETANGTTVLVDNDAPSGSIVLSTTDAVREGTEVNLTVTFSEAMPEVPQAQIAFSGQDTIPPTPLTRISETVYTYTYIAGSGDGVVDITLSGAADFTGNPVEPEPITGSSITLDNAAPAIQLTSPINNSVTGANELEIAFTVTDVFDGSIEYVVLLDGVAATSGTAISGQPETATLSPIIDGTHVIAVQAIDNAGNTGISSSYMVTVDSGAPFAVIDAPANNSTTNDTTPAITFTATDSRSVTVDYAIFVDGASNGQTGSANNSTPVTINLSALTAGAHTVAVRVSDETAIFSMSAPITIIVDLTPPSFTGNTTVNTTDETALIGWSTTELSNSTVEYGLTTAYGSFVSGTAFVTTHSVLLGNLDGNTIYHFRVISTDSAGNTVTSTDGNFTTNATATNNNGNSGGRRGGGGGGGGIRRPAANNTSNQTTSNPVINPSNGNGRIQTVENKPADTPATPQPEAPSVTATASDVAGEISELTGAVIGGSKRQRAWVFVLGATMVSAIGLLIFSQYKSGRRRKVAHSSQEGEQG